MAAAGGTGPGHRSDAAVLRSLLALGASDGAADAALRLAADLQLRAQADGNEWAGALDLQTGRLVAEPVCGGTDDVDVSPLLARLAAGGRYLCLHTHRSGAAVSDLDAAVLVANDPIHGIGVIGHDGTWYLLWKGERYMPTSSDVLVSLVRATVVAARRPYLRRVIGGEMAPDVAKRQVLHAAWRFLAPRLGLGYDRVVYGKRRQ